MIDLEFPHLKLGIDEGKFVTRLWQSMQASGHLLTRDQVKACVQLVDNSFAPPPPQPQQN